MKQKQKPPLRTCVKAHFTIRPKQREFRHIHSEGLWVEHVGDDRFKVDNIPFFASKVDRGDIVTGTVTGGHMLKPRVLQKSGHKTYRIVVKHLAKAGPLRRTLHRNGCDTERSHIQGLIAMDLPPAAQKRHILAYLRDGARRGFWRLS